MPFFKGTNWLVFMLVCRRVTSGLSFLWDETTEESVHQKAVPVEECSSFRKRPCKVDLQALFFADFFERNQSDNVQVFPGHMPTTSS